MLVKYSYDNTLWFNNILKCILLDKATMVLGMLSPAAFTPITLKDVVSMIQVTNVEFCSFK